MFMDRALVRDSKRLRVLTRSRPLDVLTSQRSSLLGRPLAPRAVCAECKRRIAQV